MYAKWFDDSSEYQPKYKMHKYINFRKSYWQKYLTTDFFIETEDMSYYVGEGLFNRFYKKVC